MDETNHDCYFQCRFDGPFAMIMFEGLAIVLGHSTFI